MSVHQPDRHFLSVPKNFGHQRHQPYFAKQTRKLASPDSTSESNVLQKLTSLLMGCRSLYAGSAGYVPHSDSQSSKVQSSETVAQENKMWVFRMSMTGYRSENINISIKESSVLVQANFGQAPKGSDRCYGLTRTVAIPETVVKERVVGYLDDQEVLVIEGPYKTTKRQKDQVVPGLGVTGGSVDYDDDDVSGRPSSTVLTDCEVPKQRLPSDSDHLFGDLLSENSNYPFKYNSNDEQYSKQFRECVRQEKKESSVGRATSTRQHNQKDFKLGINMQHVPSKYIDISVKGKVLIVRCNIERQISGVNLKESYTTEYALPSNVDMDRLTCVRTDGGVLTVTAPCLNLNMNERRIKIIDEECC